jgi:hypothetical protein
LSQFYRLKRILFNPQECNEVGIENLFLFLPTSIISNLQEPVAFWGGVFAGILRLDLNEEPLKEWITRTVEDSDINEEETNAEGSTTEDAPQEIEIE